jgi:predicted ATPase
VEKIETQAEACFRRAIEIAREQKPRSLELRAATSLSRLWQQRGKEKEAHHLLSEVYGWFTEGFDTRRLEGREGAARRTVLKGYWNEVLKLRQ